MAFQKYPQQIQTYSDLFEGDFFSQENQTQFSQLKKKIREEITKCLIMEYEQVQQESTLGTDFTTMSRKTRYFNNFLVSSSHGVHPYVYLSGLTPQDQANIRALFNDVLYNDDDGYFRAYQLDGYTALAVGSSTYSAEERDRLAQTEARDGTKLGNLPQLQSRIANRGNDIDIIIGGSQHNFLGNYNSDKQYHASIQDRYQYIIKLLKHKGISYEFTTDEREIGTNYLLVPELHMATDGKVIPRKPKNYGEASLTIKFPEGRNIHIGIESNLMGIQMMKNEFLEGRPFSTLYNDALGYTYFKQFLRDKPTDIIIPDTLEKRYHILKNNTKEEAIKKRAREKEQQQQAKKLIGKPNF